MLQGPPRTTRTSLQRYPDYHTGSQGLEAMMSHQQLLSPGLPNLWLSYSTCRPPTVNVSANFVLRLSKLKTVAQLTFILKPKYHASLFPTTFDCHGYRACQLLLCSSFCRIDCPLRWVKMMVTLVAASLAMGSSHNALCSVFADVVPRLA